LDNNVIKFKKEKQRKIVLEYSFELVFCEKSIVKLDNEQISQIEERYQTYTSMEILITSIIRHLKK